VSYRIIQGDCRDVLATLPHASAQCCVTSPPYYGLRSYLRDDHPDKAREIGLEPTPDAYIAKLVEVFRGVRRVLRDDGTLWLNVGDSYSSNPATGKKIGGESHRGSDTPTLNTDQQCRVTYRGNGIKAKDLMMIPARVAIALQADGWYLRSHIIWHKPNPMPESVKDRPTSAHESVFLFAKQLAYFYDAEAVAEPAAVTETRNLRNVWTISPKPYKGAHFAVMPEDIAERCILAGSRPGDTVLDPFGGVGTTGLVADRLGRNATLIELSAEHAWRSGQRIIADVGTFAEVRASQPGNGAAAPAMQ
jgi:DNA modification methylase